MKHFIFTTLLLTLMIKVSFGQIDERQAQATFVYNFTKFFDWPISEKTGDFVIGVLGSREMYDNLQKVTAGKKNVTQNIVVKRFNSADEITKCHVIYIDSGSSKDIENIHNKTGVNCLIISDSFKSIEKGAIIQFVLDGDRLKYDFSSENALKHGLKFHSRISEMARRSY